MPAPIVTVEAYQVDATRHKWNCPGCGEPMRQCKPPGPWDYLCNSCVVEKNEADFRDGHSFLVGSVVTELIWVGGLGFRGLTVKDAQGTEWILDGSLSCEVVKERIKC